MTWIKTIGLDKAEGKLLKLINRIKGPDDNVDNIMLAHSLRPHTMEGHMALYKHRLHNSANTLPKWLAEAIGVYVSELNNCHYCIDHHAAGLRRLLKDDGERADAIIEAIKHDEPAEALEGKELAALKYAGMLTRVPHAVGEAQINGLRNAGWDDGEILEINPPYFYSHTFKFTQHDDPYCKVSYALKEVEGGVEFTLIAEDIPADTKTAKEMTWGGKMIVNSLKSIVEKGNPSIGVRLLHVLFKLTEPMSPAKTKVENWPL